MSAKCDLYMLCCCGLQEMRFLGVFAFSVVPCRKNTRSLVGIEFFWHRHLKVKLEYGIATTLLQPTYVISMSCLDLLPILTSLWQLCQCLSYMLAFCQCQPFTCVCGASSTLTSAQSRDVIAPAFIKKYQHILQIGWAITVSNRLIYLTDGLNVVEWFYLLCLHHVLTESSKQSPVHSCPALSTLQYQVLPGDSLGPSRPNFSSCSKAVLECLQAGRESQNHYLTGSHE